MRSRVYVFVCAVHVFWVLWLNSWMLYFTKSTKCICMPCLVVDLPASQPKYIQSVLVLRVLREDMCAQYQQMYKWTFCIYAHRTLTCIRIRKIQHNRDANFHNDVRERVTKTRKPSVFMKFPLNLFRVSRKTLLCFCTLQCNAQNL